MPTPTNPAPAQTAELCPRASACFDGSFDLLPIRSHLDDGPLPSATSEAFQNAACSASAVDNDGGFITWENAARVWRMEAIRERRLNGDSASVTSHALMERVAKRLFDAAVNS